MGVEARAAGSAVVAVGSPLRQCLSQFRSQAYGTDCVAVLPAFHALLHNSIQRAEARCDEVHAINAVILSDDSPSTFDVDVDL